MGLFSRKKGGTFFGNLLRGAASTVSGGILGSGKDLSKWQAGVENREYDEVLAENQARLNANKAYLAGKGAGVPYQADGKKIIDDGSEIGVKVWLKNNWWKVAIPLVIVIGVIIYLVRRK